jgi:hypothetical protein
VLPHEEELKTIIESQLKPASETNPQSELSESDLTGESENESGEEAP